jgi:hypothetical protein
MCLARPTEAEPSVFQFKKSACGVMEMEPNTHKSGIATVVLIAIDMQTAAVKVLIEWFSTESA